MEQVIYNGQKCYIWARNGNYVTLKELSADKYHLSIHINKIQYVKQQTSNKRETWFEYIKLGYLDVNEDVRKWLDENGYSDVKRLS